jgi:hypothetical protein
MEIGKHVKKDSQTAFSLPKVCDVNSLSSLIILSFSIFIYVLLIKWLTANIYSYQKGGLLKQKINLKNYI